MARSAAFFAPSMATTRHRNSGRHLHHRKERVDALESARLDRHPDNGKSGESGDHTGKMRSSAGGCNNGGETAVAQSADPFFEFRRGAVGAQYFCFRFDAKLSESVSGGLHDSPVAGGAHNNTYFHVFIKD